MPDPSRQSFAPRDARIDALMSLFFFCLGLGVLAGVFYAQLAIDRLVNLGAALLLLAVAAIFFWRSRVQGRS